MPKCSTCGTDVSSNASFCSACGRPVSNTDDLATLDFATATSPLPPRPQPVSSSSSSSRSPSSAEYLLNEGRFLPGRLVASRYRIIALLGKGGMGEVYRADDLTLGQAVALKFLPDGAARDEGLVERFRNEVRMARRVSHPNVCRVYDVGEVDGQTFFTMEYVDGEDLASLLRRIGRLPPDKALDIARHLCAGLAAAHSKGVLHRDLKPANIMLDGRGQVVITDFGLAGVADDIRGAEVRSGTPAYMAPEQLTGQEVTMSSDIYSLGLVLYEVFTGKRAFAESPALARTRAGHTPSRPSTVVKDLDPIVEKVILRCLETDPASRPPTALAIAAALPGGDPLAAALAAGETPSPQLVAASGETFGLRPRVAVAFFAAALVALALATFMAAHYSALEKMRLELTPEVLTQKSREIITRLGYPGHPADRAFGLNYDNDFQEFVEKKGDKNPDWNAILPARPSLVHYWYRQSPDDMAAFGFQDQLLNPGIVKPDDPPTVLSGMINLELDPQGQLTYFQAIPPEKESAKETLGPAGTFDWNILFSAAGLDPTQFQKTEPQWNSLAASDSRIAWTGTWPGTKRPLRVEAAAWRGKPVFFSLIGDWTKPQRTVAPDDSFGEKVRQSLLIALVLCLLGGALYLARRNYRRGRGDREGAFRLASVIFVLQMLLWLCRGHLIASVWMFFAFVIAVSTSLFYAGLTWMLYLALEPWIRRHWPQTIISWSRLLTGKFRDPLVGRDILFGVMLGVVWILIIRLRLVFEMRLGAAPELYQTDYLLGGRAALGGWLAHIALSITGTLQFFFILLALKIVLRKEWLAAIAFVALFALPRGLTSTYMPIELPAQILIYAIAVLIVVRFGLIPLACAIFTVDMVSSLPFSSDLSTWYMATSITAILSVVALAGWGFYHSLGGTPLWVVENDD